MKRLAILLMALMLVSIGQGVAAQGNGYVPFTATYTVDVNQAGWHSTGIVIQGGASINVTGEASCDIDETDGIYPLCVYYGAEGYPDWQVNWGAGSFNAWSLVGRVGDGAPFQMVSGTQLIAGDGELQLFYNENVFGDNGGEYVVTVTSCRPGKGTGDKNHCHFGAPGQ